jgi:hypothetical protein
MVTLIGEKIAKENEEFTYLGPNNDCKNCKLKTVCFNLKPGRRYKIKKVRDKRHNCNVHQGTVVVVEVEEIPIITAIDKKYSEGSKLKIEKIDCDNIGCKNYYLCKVKLQKDKKYTITKVYDDIDCPLGYTLKKVELSDK